MDFQLNEDQRAFASMAEGLFADFCTDDRLRAHDLSSEPFMRELWKQCVASGLHGVLVPEAEGGLGLGMVELMAVLEQQGRALAPVPLWETQVAAAALARFEPAAAQQVLPAVLAGDKLIALALASLTASRGAALRLQPHDQGWRLDGVVPAVPLGGVADCALLAADDGSAMRLVLVDLSTGVQRTPGRSQHHQDVADLAFDKFPVDTVLAPEATAWTETRAIACCASVQLGITLAQLQRTVTYVSERRQFDRPIGSFQLVAGGMADGYIAAEALRGSLCQLAWRIDAGLGCVPQAHATRTLANDMGHRVGHMAQHVHGGMGVDLTYPMHRYLYWSRVLGAALGGTEHHLARLGDWLADNDNLGWKYDLAEDNA